MPKNIGAWDRTLRIALGVALLSLVFVGPKTLWGLVGLIPLITGLARFCPAYGIAGVNTCGMTNRKGG
jgi:cadmium resistance protein CadD (predicted permease)